MTLFKNAFQALSEAAKSDTSKIVNLKEEVDRNSVLEAFKSIGLLETSYTVKGCMIPLVETEIEGEQAYALEMGFLAAFMNSTGCESIKEAIDDIADGNEVDPSKVIVVVDDKDVDDECCEDDDYDDDEEDEDDFDIDADDFDTEEEMEEFSEAVKKVKKQQKKNKKAKTVKLLDQLKKNGIKVFKKKK